MPLTSRKRRRKLCSCVSSLLLLGAGAAGARGVGSQDLEQQPPPQAFETVVPVTRYSSTQSQTHVNDATSASFNASSSGRYGHAAVYQQYQNKILFIGGQIGTTGTFITNDVLSLDLTVPYQSSNASGTPFTDTTNPALLPDLSQGLPPNAWSAYATDAQERIWLIGGVTQDCESDAVAYVLEGASTWTPVNLGNYRPPRRRQARAVSVPQGTEDTTIYVFGGVAEPYTCSLETVGYLAMDVWNTSSIGTTPLVGSESWKEPRQSLLLSKDSMSSFEPAISDYAAISVPALQAILYLGGQDASGKLVAMDEALLFNTTTKAWSQKPITGEVPTPIMGHSATALNDGRIVVFGGVGEQGTPLPKTYILEISSDSSWHWSVPDVSNSIITSPARAWHSATLAEDGVIVVAFGLDGATGETVEDIYFLRTSPTMENWRWSESNPLALAASLTNADSVTSVYTPNSRVLVNVAADDGISNYPPATIDPAAMQRPMAAATSLALTRPTLHDALETGSPEGDDYLGPNTSSASSSSHMSASLYSKAVASDTTARPSSGSSSTTTSSKTSVIAGTVTAAFVAALAIGAAALYVRRRASAQNTEKSVGGAGGDSADSGAPPVTQLLYTRAAPKRMLSLGSAFSVQTSESMSELHHGGITFERVTGTEAREAVDEFGKLSPRSDTATIRGPTAHGMSHTSSADSMETTASVASYPFLTSVPRALDATSQDSHGGGDLGLNLLGIRSVDDEVVKTPQFTRWPSSFDSVDAQAGSNQTRSLSGNPTHNPFDDFHQVLPDTPSYTSSNRQREMSTLPASLRPGA